MYSPKMRDWYRSERAVADRLYGDVKIWMDTHPDQNILSSGQYRAYINYVNHVERAREIGYFGRVILRDCIVGALIGVGLVCLAWFFLP